MMLTDNLERAELIVTTFFKMDELKRRICTKNNQILLDFLNCHHHIQHMLIQAVRAEDDEILHQQIIRVIDYTSKLIDYARGGRQNVENMAVAEEVLVIIRQRLQLLEASLIKPNDQNSMVEYN